MLAVVLLLLPAVAIGQDGQTRTFTDSAGREIIVPAKINHVFAAGPPASILLYTLAPDKLLGWTREVRAPEREFLPAKYADLPVHGRLTGKGNTANLETVVAMQPDIILDVGDIDPTYVSLAERVQEQTGIPYVLLDGSFEKTADTYRMLGKLLGEETRGAELADYAEQTMTQLSERLAQIPSDTRPRVYYGRGPDGLETGLAGSINVEILEQVGATNVTASAGTGGLTTVSPEQIIGWDPDVIILADANFYRSVADDPRWQGMKAIRDARIYLVPSLPFGWFDAPPGVNRLIGVRWLTAVLYPNAFPEDLRSITRDFYSRFYHVELSDPQLDKLLKPATAGPS